VLNQRLPDDARFPELRSPETRSKDSATTEN
jgi:hypothetical protein